MEYIEIMSTTEIFEKVLALVDRLKTRSDLDFKVSNTKDLCVIEYGKDVYNFFYKVIDSKLNITIVEVNEGMPAYFGEDLNTPKFRNILLEIYRYLETI